MLGVLDCRVTGFLLGNSFSSIPLVLSVGSGESCFPLYSVDTFTEPPDTEIFVVGRFYERNVIRGAECNLSASCQSDTSVIVSADNVGKVALTGGSNCGAGSS